MAGIKQFDEDEVLNRALVLFWRQGFGATSMQDLAQATGVLRGSLYHAYGDKRALFLRIYARYSERYLVSLGETMAAEAPEEALRRYFRFAVDMITVSDDKITRGCLTTKTATDETAMDESIRQALRGLLDTAREVIAERLSRPDAQARLRLPADAAAALIMTTTRGMVVMERVYGERARLEAVGEDLVRLLMPEQA